MHSAKRWGRGTSPVVKPIQQTEVTTETYFTSYSLLRSATCSNTLYDASLVAFFSTSWEFMMDVSSSVTVATCSLLSTVENHHTGVGQSWKRVCLKNNSSFQMSSILAGIALPYTLCGNALRGDVIQQRLNEVVARGRSHREAPLWWRNNMLQYLERSVLSSTSTFYNYTYTIGINECIQNPIWLIKIIYFYCVLLFTDNIVFNYDVSLSLCLLTMIVSPKNIICLVFLDGKRFKGFKTNPSLPKQEA